MLASVLRSERAVVVSVAIVRAFVQLRELLSTHRELAVKLAQLERKLERHDAAIGNLCEATFLGFVQLAAVIDWLTHGC